jgi:hypothetical protein
MHGLKVTRQAEKGKPIDHHSTDNFEHIRLLLVTPHFGDGTSSDGHGDVPFSHVLRLRRLHDLEQSMQSYKPTINEWWRRESIDGELMFDRKIFSHISLTRAGF